MSAGSADSCSSARIQEFCAGVDLLEPGAEGGGAGVTVRGRGGVGGGELGGEQPGAAGTEHVPVKNRATIWSRRVSGALTVRGWPGLAAACRGFAGLCGHW